MITLKQFMEVIDYRITEGCDYQWECYGPNPYSLDSWDGIVNGRSFSVVFDRENQTVFEVTAYDYANNRAYRLINPAYTQAHKDEATARNINHKEAWDDVEYTDLETAEDFIEKATAIFKNEDYDTRVQVPLTLDKDQMYDLMMLAHEADMTLNEYAEKVLREEIDRLQSQV